ncbi:MAG: MarR family protein [Firmicutes bacterium]|nr:MarR family protein [Bacillota bacterium]
MSYIKSAEMMFHLIPTIDIKFMRPVSLRFKPHHTPIQFHILTIVKEKKATMTELSTETLLSKQQMTPLIDKLVAEALVQREYDAFDRRIIRISITPAGLQLLEQTKEQALKLLQDKFKLLDEQDLTSLNNALSELARIFHKLP